MPWVQMKRFGRILVPCSYKKKVGIRQQRNLPTTVYVYQPQYNCRVNIQMSGYKHTYTIQAFTRITNTDATIDEIWAIIVDFDNYTFWNKYIR